jgi:hypothetical protein
VGEGEVGKGATERLSQRRVEEVAVDEPADSDGTDEHGRRGQPELEGHLYNLTLELRPVSTIEKCDMSTWAGTHGIVTAAGS